MFDFDGLILDTETTLYEAWRTTYETHGLALPLESWGVNVGGLSYEAFHPLDRLEAHVGATFDREAVNLTRKELYLSAVWVQEALPGAAEAMDAVRAAGLRLGVASSSSREWVQGHLERLGLWGHVDASAFGDEVAEVKPHPEIYLKVLELLEVAPQRAVAFEDSLKGVHAAKAAGMYCVAVPNPVTKVLDLSVADCTLPALGAMPLERILQSLVSS